MQTQITIATLMSATGNDQNSLYRLTFVGGPFDGHEAQSDDLPDTYLQLQSDPTRCNSKAGPAVMPRVARYKLASVRLAMSDHVPVIRCRFEYCGNVAISSSRRSLYWRRPLAALCRWFKPRPSGCSGQHP